MSSKAYTTIATDSSGYQLSDQALVAREGAMVGSNSAAGDINNTVTDFGSVKGGLDLGGRVLDVVSRIADNAGALSRSSIEATQNAALETTRQLDAAYAQARGTVNANTATIVVAVLVVAALVAFAVKGAK